jgi:hypothetical protein
MKGPDGWTSNQDQFMLSDNSEHEGIIVYKSPTSLIVRVIIKFNVFLHHYKNNESLRRKRWNLVEHLKNQWGKIFDLFAKSIFQLLVAGSSDARRFGFLW